ncbi:MAG: STT3 domain-containing protein [Thermodesulfovibrionales bacterium]
MTLKVILDSKSINTIKCLLIVFVCLLSIFLKLKDIGNFTKFDDFVTTYDAFRYARYAIEIQNDSYERIDYLSDVPDYAIRQYPPPLLSQLAVWLSDISQVKIQYFFLLLPPILSILFVIPLYFWLKPLNNTFVTIGAITLGLFNFFYFVRTRMGYFDTDCMMLFFIFTLLFFISKAVSQRDDWFSSYKFILLAGLSMQVFRWWYDHLFFVLIIGISLFIGLLVNRHPIKDILLKLLFFFILASPVELVFYVLNSPFLRDYIYGTIFNIQGFKMPINIYSSVGELLPVSFRMSVWFTTDNLISFCIASAGFLILLYKRFRFLALSLPFLSIGLLSYSSGNRYLIYLGPFLGMGFGYAMYLSIQFINRVIGKYQTPIYLAGTMLSVFLLVPPQITKFITKPMYEERRVINYKKISELTVKDAYIWSWWGIGNPLQYYSQRAVFTDNSNFNPLKIYLFIQSMTSEREDFTFKSISFVANKLTGQYDMKGDLQRLIDNINSYKINPSKPVYVMLYDGMLSRFIFKDHALSKDEAERLSKRLPINHTRCNLRESISDCFGISYDMAANQVNITDDKIIHNFNKILVINKNLATQHIYTLNPASEENLYLIVAKDGRVYKNTAHKDFEETMLYRMMILSENNLRHFELVHEDYPYMVLYKVKHL